MYTRTIKCENSNDELAAVKNDRIPDSTYSNGEYSFGYEVPSKKKETDNKDIQNG